MSLGLATKGIISMNGSCDVILYGADIEIEDNEPDVIIDDTEIVIEVKCYVK